MRGDGNCYYRSVANGLIELLTLKRLNFSILRLINWICTDRPANYYYIPNSNLNLKNAIIRNLFELVRDIDKQKSDAELFNKV